MRFLVCIDDTEFSRAAADSVRDLANRAGATVHLFRVLVPTAEDRAEPYSGSTDEVLQAREQEFEAREPRARQRLEELATNFSGPTEIAIWSHPDTAEAVIEYAEENSVDLIALATHSREELPDERHLGSTAERITLSGVAPVFLVHRLGAERQLALDAFSPGTPVFTADAFELGHVGEAREDAFRIEGTGGGSFWLPRRSAAAVQGGRMVLHWDMAMVERETGSRTRT